MDFNRDLVWTNFLPNILRGINQMKRKVLFNFSSHQVKFDREIENIVQKKFLIKLNKFQQPFKSKPPKYEPNQVVKVVRKTRLFQRGYDAKTEGPTDVIKSVNDTAPYTYNLKHKRRPYYDYELIPFGPPPSASSSSSDGSTAAHASTDEKDKKRFVFHISEERPIQRRQLRSGLAREPSADEKLYLLRRYDQPAFSEWIDDSEKRNLIKNGQLLPDHLSSS